MMHAIILVVYQKRLSECEAGKTLQEILPRNSVVCIYDNSESDFGNQEYCEENGWIYLTQRRNMGLSIAYQACVDHLLSKGFNGWISLFDDDTTVAADYFGELSKAFSKHPECSIFFPLLYAEDKLISPQIIPANQRVRYFASKQECLAYNGPDLFAFNSGMAVHSGVYQQVRYDKRLFLDCIDYSFLLSCGREGFRMAPFDVEMKHGFSGMQHQPYETALKRFECYARDHSIVLQNNPGGYRYLIGKRALHLMWIYKKTIFLRIFWKYLPKDTPN